MKKKKLYQTENKPQSFLRRQCFLSGKTVGKRREKKSEVNVAPEPKRSKAQNKTAIMRQNVLEVLLKSTVLPFRWLKSSFRCFYCYDVFQEPKDLKAHQIIHTSDDDKLKAMKNYWEPTVYVDVSNLACKLCPAIITDFYKLIDHLIEVHNMHFNKDIGICMNPFRLNHISVQCVQCDRECRTFGHLLVHTNKEHKGCTQVLCEFCGQHFKSNTHLRDHMNKIHSNRSVLCPLCGEEIHSANRMRTHMQNVHNKRYKCGACPELFDTHYKRSRHMMLVHKTREEVKCQHCPRSFVFRSTMMRHVRETHLQERNAICGVCGWRAFGAGRLQRHMMKHSNERNFKCPACEKAFKTKKTMKQHYTNIHEKGARVHDLMPGVPDPLVPNSI